MLTKSQTFSSLEEVIFKKKIKQPPHYHSGNDTTDDCPEDGKTEARMIYEIHHTSPKVQ